MKPRAPLRVGGAAAAGDRPARPHGPAHPRAGAAEPVLAAAQALPGAAARPSLPHMASWSLSLSLLQKIVLGLREPARLEAGAKAPPVPTAPAVAASAEVRPLEAPRKLPALPARQLWVSSAKPASSPAASRSLPVAPLAAAATPTLRRRAAPRPVAAVSPTGSPIGRLIGTPSAFRRASAGSGLGQRDAARSFASDACSGPARIGRPLQAGPCRLDWLRVGARRRSMHRRCAGLDRPAAAARIDAFAGPAHGGPVDRHRRLPAPRGHGRRCSGARPPPGGRARLAGDATPGSRRPACRR